MNDDATDLGSAGFGLMFYNARMYDPYITQFSQPDSIIPDQYNPQAWNRYSYAFNNPLRYTDPSGHCPICVVVALVGTFFVLNSTNDTQQLNISPQELAGRQTSFAVGVTALSLVNPAVNHLSNVYDCATGNCDLSLMVPGSASAYSNTPENSADDVAETIGPLPESEVPNFASGNAVPNIYDEGTSLYRVHSEGKEYGNWWLTESPSSEAQWRIDAAVPPQWGNTAEKVSELTVPPGSQIGGWSGPASYKGDFYVGGGNQVYLPFVPSQWIQTMDFTEFANKHYSGR